MADATTRTATTLDEANEAGFLGAHVDVLPPDGYTLDAVVAGPAVTDDAYAEQRAAEHRPPPADVSTEAPPEAPAAASTSSASSSKSSKSSGSSGS
jgi:hypothetical protein